MSCWKAEPQDRPDFKDLVEVFEELLSPYLSDDPQNPKNPGYTRLSVMARHDIQSSDMYSHAAEFSNDYLTPVDTPNIDDLLLTTEASEIQNGQLQKSHSSSGAQNISDDIPTSPPPAPHSKPKIPQKPSASSGVGFLSGGNNYDNNYLNTRNS